MPQYRENDLTLRLLFFMPAETGSERPKEKPGLAVSGAEA